MRAARPDGAPIYVIMDNLSARKSETIRHWAGKNRVELCFTPTYASWANRSRPTSARCASSPSPTPPPQPHRPDPGTARLPAQASAGADAHSPPQPDQAGEHIQPEH
ncbi:transposase [Catellatospora sp. KI3]|nr:transposase [Catellatospora sp. KI3]MDI1463225.1 transposase [Catellatospora sp. KI3]